MQKNEISPFKIWRELCSNKFDLIELEIHRILPNCIVISNGNDKLK